MTTAEFNTRYDAYQARYPEYHAGLAAARSDAKFLDNPHDPETVQGRRWIDGYVKGLRP